MLERIKIENEYYVGVDGNIQSYGPYFRQPLYTPYFWGRVKQNNALYILGPDGICWFQCKVSPYERTVFPELMGTDSVLLREAEGRIVLRVATQHTAVWS